MEQPVRANYDNEINMVRELLEEINVREYDVPTMSA
jgi:hypothetical protein